MAPKAFRIGVYGIALLDALRFVLPLLSLQTLVKEFVSSEMSLDSALWKSFGPITKHQASN
jgi:hypothetical protein